MTKPKPRGDTGASYPLKLTLTDASGLVLDTWELNPGDDNSDCCVFEAVMRECGGNITYGRIAACVRAHTAALEVKDRADPLGYSHNEDVGPIGPQL